MLRLSSVPFSIRLRKEGSLLQNNELSGTRKAAFNAADKAQEALNNAKDKLFGGPKAWLPSLETA